MIVLVRLLTAMTNISYDNCTFLIATKHHKQDAIAPALQHYLHATFKVTENFDTDQFGTFSGEVKRIDTALETCVKKAKAAASLHDANLVIANEGSFNPDPIIPFLASDVEIMCCYDRVNDRIITEYLRSHQTNHAQLMLTENVDLDKFLEKTKFPSHALLLRDCDNNQIIAKGIQQQSELEQILQQHSTLHLQLETDMRAMHNPSRMTVIAELADKLAQRLARACPHCQAAGFGEISTADKLRCELCNNLTDLYAHQVCCCDCCGYEEKRPRPDGHTAAPPDYCQFCNP